MDADGSNAVTWTPGSDDLEGIAIADPESGFLYVGVENPDSIKEFDPGTGNYTGKVWPLTSWMTGPANAGLEALTFLSNGYHPYPPSASGGLFYAGLETDGRIYVFDLDLDRSGAVAHVDTIEPFPGANGLTGLHFHPETGILYAVYRNRQQLLELEPDGTFIRAFTLAGNHQEGVTLLPGCPGQNTSIFIAEDDGDVRRYDGYPIACPAGASPTPPGATPEPTATPGKTPSPTPAPTASPAPGIMTFQHGVAPDPYYVGASDSILAADGNENANLGGYDTLEVFYQGREEARRSLLRWDISALPPSAAVRSARVELYRHGGDAAGEMPVALYRLTRDWAEGSGDDFWPGSWYVPDGATWGTSDGSATWQSPGGDYDAATDYGFGPNGIIARTTLPAGMEPGWLRLDVTEVVRDWAENGVPNRGLILRALDGEWTYHYFHSREAAASARRPRLVVEYGAAR